MDGRSSVFYPKLSNYLLFYLLLLHVFVAVCLIATLDGVLLCLSFVVLLIVGAFYFGHYFGFFSSDRIDALQCVLGKQWCLFTVEGVARNVLLSGSSVITRYVIVLHFIERHTQKKYPVLLFPDSLPKDQIRLVRRYARLGFM